MSFYPEGPETGRPVPQLPGPGWLPDPSEIHLERYWDGMRWTHRTRDRATKQEIYAGASSLYSAQPTHTYSGGSQAYLGGPRDWTPPKRKRFRGWGALGFTLLLFVAFGVAYQYFAPFNEQLPLASPPEQVGPQLPADPLPDLGVPPPPPLTPGDVDYPVFGSTELVTHLEAAMVAQQPTIDVSVWVADGDTDALGEALMEAGVQNPYLYVSGWEMMRQGDRVEISPAYIYDDAEAERRRAQTAQAVTQGLDFLGLHDGMSEREKVTLIHNYIAEIADYDRGAFDAIELGEESARVHQSQEAYGILVEGTAVCNGYAMAFSAMAEQAGLDVVTVTGTDIGGETGGNHAWNKVRVDGQWLLVDVTWDDPLDWDGPPLDRYLMIEDNDPLLETRTIGTDWVVSENLYMFHS